MRNSILAKNHSPYDEKKVIGELHSSPYIKRFEHNPILTASQVPFKVDLAFNAGVNKLGDTCYMAFRFDCFAPGRTKITNSGTGFAQSSDGLQWNVFPEPIKFHHKGKLLEWVNDARLTVLDDKLYLSFCFNSIHGERPGIALWKGGCDFEVIYLGIPAQRNLILCPGQISGRYWRLERPVTRRPVYDIWLSYSEDLIHWGESELLLGVEDIPYATWKIGGGAPPILTDRGWLMFFHAVDNDPAREVIYRKPWKCHWSSRYTMGCALLDPDNPNNVIAITPKPLLVPEMAYETGNMELFFRENVIFPCGVLLEKQNLRIYYGAGDFSTCMASICLDDLWREMSPYQRVADTAAYSRLDLEKAFWNNIH